MSLLRRLAPITHRHSLFAPSNIPRSFPYPRFLHQSQQTDTAPPSDKSQSSPSQTKQHQQQNPIDKGVVLHRLHKNHHRKQSHSKNNRNSHKTNSRTHRHHHHYNNMDDNSESGDMSQHKELLTAAAAKIRSDQIAREQSRPQSAGEGTVRLLGESLGGVALGAAAVVMGPIQGYKQNGPKGIVGGVLGGLAVGVATTTVGIGSGITHFVQGTSKTMSNLTPKKIENRLVVDEPVQYPPPTPVGGSGSSTTRKQHDMPENSEDHFHQHKSYPGADVPPEHSADPEQLKKNYLEERKRLYGELMAEHSAESAAASMDGLTPPVDMSLYDELQVDSDATPSQIRKAYYRMAQMYHPDKHPNDPEATARFQKISSAYQVLSDPVKREEYHRVGESAANDEGLMDPKTLFVLMFADFEHIVGDLATATILMSGQGEEDKDSSATTGDASSSSTPGAAGAANEETVEAKMRAEERRANREKKRMQFQRLREEQLVKLLERRFQPWMDGEETLFIEHAKHEVRYLRDQPFGRDCLKTAGYIYGKRAKKVLDSKGVLNGVTNFFEDIGDKAHSFKSKIRALEGGIKALTVNEQAEENETIDEAARKEAIATLGAVWLSSVVDIESTLRKVMTAFLKSDDKTPGNKALMKRKAEGLVVLSKIFDQA